MEPRLREKLHPALGLILDAFRIAREQRDSSAPLSWGAGFVANLLNGLTYLMTDVSNYEEGEHRKDPGPAPVEAESTAEESGLALMSQLNIVAPLLRKEAQMELAEALPDFINGARAERGRRLRQTLKPMLAMASAAEESAGPVERVFTAPMLNAVRSARSNRNPQAAFQKLSHHLILTFLFLFGALRGTTSELSLGRLTLEEITEVFNWCCPACREAHSPEALRKSTERFVRNALRRWPANKMRGSRSHVGTVEIRHSGPSEFQPGQPLGV